MYAFEGVRGQGAQVEGIAYTYIVLEVAVDLEAPIDHLADDPHMLAKAFGPPCVEFSVLHVALPDEVKHLV